MTSYIWQKPEWPRFTWEAQALLGPLGRARMDLGSLIQQVNSLGFDLDKESQAEILTEETVKTAAIEGDVLERNSVRSSVAKRLGLPTAGLPPSNRSIEGLVDVLHEATRRFDQPLTAKRLKSWHAALFPTGFSGFHKIRAGKWRGPDPMRVVSGPIGRERVHFEAPSQDRLPEEMNRYIRWWNSESRAIDGLLRAGIAHFYFITIHPFEDGNGRLARALTDMALAQDDKLRQRFYSFSARIMTERAMYYDVLEKCQKGSLDVTLWLDWFLECFLRALKDSRLLISKSLHKARFWQKQAGVDLNARQKKVLNKLLDAGPGGFEGGMTTRKYVSITSASRATAFREISDLFEKGLLRALKGRGRSTAYELIFTTTVCYTPSHVTRAQKPN